MKAHHPDVQRCSRIFHAASGDVNSFRHAGRAAAARSGGWGRIGSPEALFWGHQGRFLRHRSLHLRIFQRTRAVSDDPEAVYPSPSLS
jgi:hypothetical protein